MCDTAALFSVTCERPWLIARFAEPHRVASWSLNRPGIVEAHDVAWLEVRDADLPLDVDPRALLERRLLERDLSDAVGLMTSRDVRRHHVERGAVNEPAVDTLITLGLSNGVAFGRDGLVVDAGRRAAAGTVNMLVALSIGLDEAALLEAISIATVARTAALLAAGDVVGTGTDCIAIASPRRGSAERHVGLHTPAGRQIAASVHRATAAARRAWGDEVTNNRI